MTQGEYTRIRAKLAVAKDIAEDFRLNTTLRTIIKSYESVLKEAEKTMRDEMKSLEMTTGAAVPRHTEQDDRTKEGGEG
jgi:hypothetical protein